MNLVDDAKLNELLGKGTPVVADFFADWCHPCHVLAPELERLATRFTGEIEFVKIDVDADPAIAAELGIRGVPTVIHFSEDGSELARSVGAVRADELAKRLRLE